MGKELSEMSLQELWELFLIFLVQHDDLWCEYYKEIETQITELYFRNYLNEHPQIAKEYETLKLELWKKHEHNRDAYTEAKTDFIRKWTTKALKL